MEIRVNGQPEEIASPVTVSELIEIRNISDKGVAVAVNDSVVPKSEWTATTIQAGDRIEIVRATQGG